MLTRRYTAQLLLAAIAVMAAPAVGRAQTYPNQVIRVIVPYTAGSPVDAAARIVTAQMQKQLGQSIIIENRAGAGTTTGTKAAAAAPADGYTLLFTGSSLGYFKVLYPSLDFDSMKSLAPVAMAVTWSHLIVVSTDLPIHNIAELIAYAKANPGKLVFGYGLATPPHILGDALKRATGADISFVPYRGGEQARTDFLGGRVHINIAPTGSLMPLIREGKARPIAFTGPSRSPDLPDVPTTKESGYPQVGFNPDIWLGFLAPAGTPADIIEKLNGVVAASLANAETKSSLAKLGFEPTAMKPDEFKKFMAKELDEWPPRLQAAGIQAVQ